MGYVAACRAELANDGICARDQEVSKDEDDPAAESRPVESRPVERWVMPQTYEDKT